MAKLIQEIWEAFDDKVRTSGVYLAGPDGDQFRKLLQAEAATDVSVRCVGSFEAESHFEAMTIYYHHCGWGEYQTDFAEDREPYPQEWVQRQRSGTN